MASAGRGSSLRLMKDFMQASQNVHSRVAISDICFPAGTGIDIAREWGLPSVAELLRQHRPAQDTEADVG